MGLSLAQNGTFVEIGNPFPVVEAILSRELSLLEEFNQLQSQGVAFQITEKRPVNGE